MYKIKDLIAKLESGAFDSRFKSLYNADDIKVQGQRLRYANAVRQFGEIYGEEQSVSIYSAPGRTEIGGNHTDHNNGVVMAAAVNLDIIAVVSKTNSNCIKVKSH
ncbi:MAG: galactokinase family protein, partial [Oscillospiraceae bacterium]